MTAENFWPFIYNFNPFDWSALSAVAALLGLAINIFLLATVYIGYRSIRDGQAAHVSNILIWAAEQMDSIKEDIQVIRNNKDPHNEFSDEYQSSARRVSAIFQRLGYMAHNGLINPIHFKNMWGLSFVLMWQELEPWVKHLREQNGEPKTLSEGAFSRVDFERMALKYEKHFSEIINRMQKTQPTDEDLTDKDKH
ncbi:DUF4760 domain-containing protein [Thalassospira marina]|uniref:DUF4760 domain-containing protein n=1 Tax=Thalassospira marina TaxID=2048283 RepID=A0ABN5FI16_9PROT|nr:hypothetical protein [Thalassospira marina]AUG54275.1 hypothetical protein CSC3H3_17285 [Thalassospira marina]